MYDCNLKGNLDVSSLSGLGGSFKVNLNTGLTSVTLPASTQVFNTFLANGCTSLGYINFWPISGSSSSPIVMSLKDNSWTASIVNHVLYDLDQIGWTDGTLSIGGNTPADGSSGGYNGTASTVNLAAKGWNII